MEQKDFFAAKLAFELDACDLFKAVKKNPGKYVIVDARSRRAYDMEHIQGAINLHYDDMNEENTKNWDKDKVYISYCDGLGCNASTKGAYGLSKLGFKVKELIGGIDGWKYEGHPVERNMTEFEFAEAKACDPACSCQN